jgi:hypothetical protein
VTPTRELLAQVATSVRESSGGQRALRGLLALTALAAFTLEPDRGLTLAGIAAWTIVLTVPLVVAMPGGDAPLGVLIAATVSWLAGWGGELPPVATTVLLGAVLYLHHVTAALAAAMPASATLDRSLLRRWSIPLLAGALGLLIAALAAYRTTQLPLSPTLQLAGLIGTLLTAGLLALLARR